MRCERDSTEPIRGNAARECVINCAFSRERVRSTYPYACELKVHFTGVTDEIDPPTISAGRDITELKTSVPLALKIPKTPSICKWLISSLSADEA